MNILNTIRIGLSLTLLVVVYIFVAISGIILFITDKLSGSELSTCDYKTLWKTLWKMFKDEVQLIKQGLL